MVHKPTPPAAPPKRDRIAIAKEKPEMIQQTCKSCRFMRLDPSLKQVCCLAPPQAHLIPQRDGAVVIAVQSPTPPSNYCSKYEPDPVALS